MFSKTRIAYYDNNPSTAVIGSYTDFTIENPEPGTSYPYLTVKFPSSLHNWSYVPVNAYGLYCSFAEIQSLVENNDSFIPEEIEITVGHTIPLAKYPSTSNSTQLSFNNTIYSLIGVEDDNYIGIHSYLHDDEIDSLVRTFDGVDVSSATAGTRTTLPKRDMYFRIPYHSLLTSGDNTAPPVNQVIQMPNATTNGENQTLTVAERLEYAQNIGQLIDSYIPELLQNNDKIYTLYPGENQFQKNFTNFSPRYCALDCSGTSFNETLWQQDQRLNALINRDVTHRSADSILGLPIAFNIGGNNADVLPETLNAGNTADLTLDTIKMDLSKLFDIYYNRDGTNDYNSPLSKVFIKGVPIVDDTNSVVPHIFCCTITWTLKVKCTPRSNMNTNRLQWRMTYPYLQATKSATNGLIQANYVHQGNFAKKPYRSDKFKRVPFMRFNNLTPTELSTNYTRSALKNIFQGNVRNIIKPVVTAPDNIMPSQFGSSMPFAAGWYEGFSFLTNSNVPV